MATSRKVLAPDLGYVERNKAAWERWAPSYREAARLAWDDPELRWGMWGTPESELGLLGGMTARMNALELGCGAGSLSAGLARSGLHVVGVDIARGQVENAMALEMEHDVRVRFHECNAEAIPYDDGSFDLAVSEYGASLWCEPEQWVREASRLLRPGGLLVFIAASPLLMTCTGDIGDSVSEHLERPYFGMHRFEFSGDDAVEFHQGHGDWFRVLSTFGFTVEDLIEVQPSPHAVPRHSFVSNEWARKWPSEDIWIARRR